MMWGDELVFSNRQVGKPVYNMENVQSLTKAKSGKKGGEDVLVCLFVCVCLRV